MRCSFIFSFCLLLAFFAYIIPGNSRAEENPELQGLVDELRSLAEKSRDQRAADRWLQQALEDLVSKYDWPWRKKLFSEDFSDGDFTTDPEWRVVSGRFWIDASLGLRSRVEPQRGGRPDDSSQTQSSDSNQDLGRALLGTLLNEALKQEGSREDKSQTRREPSREGPARIKVASEITNAFFIQIMFSIHNEPSVPGHFEFALHQDQSGGFGYKMAIHTGQGGMMDLYRLRRGYAELVYSSRMKADPGDGKRHELVWRQAGNGQIEVFMDGKETMNLRDRAFRDGYKWLELSNLSGELGVRKLKILGTP
jgi:hypothetical protein